MLVVHALPLRLGQLPELLELLGLVPLALLVVAAHPDVRRRRQQQDGRHGGEVEPVADVVVGRIPGHVRPGRHEAADVAEHDVEADGHCARRVRDDVGGDLAVGEGAEGECLRIKSARGTARKRKEAHTPEAMRNVAP